METAARIVARPGAVHDLILLNSRDPVEADWLRYVMAPLKLIQLEAGQPAPVYPGALYLYSSVFRMNLDQTFLSRVKEAGGCGLVHVGDEYYRGDFSAYASFDFVIRMMAFKAISAPGIFALPLGTTNQLGPACRTPASIRRLAWVFAGDWKADRHVMAKAFENIPRGLNSLPRSYMGETGISRAEYIDSMANAVFAPCPSGNVCMETFRPYEALHLGAIPLLPRRRLSDPYRDVLGPHPLPTFEDWRSAARFAAKMLASPTDLDRLQTECLDWWEAYKPALQQRLTSFVAEGQSGEFRPAMTGHFSQGLNQLSRLRALLVQQNTDQTIARAAFHLRRLTHKLLTGKTLTGRWSMPGHEPAPTPDASKRHGE